MTFWREMTFWQLMCLSQSDEIHMIGLYLSLATIILTNLKISHDILASDVLRTVRGYQTKVYLSLANDEGYKTKVNLSLANESLVAKGIYNIISICL